MAKYVEVLAWHVDLSRNSGSRHYYWTGKTLDFILSEYDKCSYINYEVKYNGEVIESCINTVG